MKSRQTNAQPDYVFMEGLDSFEQIGNPPITTMVHENIRYTLSFFNDDIWDFRPIFIRESANGAKKIINWDVYPFNDILYRELKIKVKLFIYSLMSDPIEHLKTPKAATIIKKFNQITQFCQWLAEAKYFCFSDPEVFNKYHAFVRKSSNTTETQNMKLAILRDMYHQSCKIPLIGLTYFPGDDANTRTQPDSTSERSEEIRYIPEQIAHNIASLAISFVERERSRITSALCEMKSREKEAKAKGMHPDNVSRARGLAAKAMGFKGTLDLNCQERTLRDCCYIIILFFSGMRQSEVLSIKKGAIRKEALDIDESLIWLDATLYKTSREDHGEAASWLVPNIVVSAIDTLQDIREVYIDDIEEYIHKLEHAILANEDVQESRIKLQRIVNDLNNLFVTYDSRSNSWGCVTGKTMDKYLKQYCVDRNIDHQLSSHQFRHTFARMVARHKLGDLHYLRDHFKHWSQDMTNGYAGANNNDIFEEISEEVARHKENIIFNLLKSKDDLLGKRGAEIQRFRGTIVNEQNIKEIAISLAPDTYIRGNGHSWCISSPGKQCSGICVYDRTLCGNCENATIERSCHLPIWYELKSQLEETIGYTSFGSPARQRAEAQLKRIEMFLQKAA